MNIQQRTKLRKRNIIAHKATDFDDAERWDLEFWQKQTPQMRLSALVAIINDINAINPNKLKD